MARITVPLGFHFCPKDEELIYYLKNKNAGVELPCDVIEEFDVYSCSPEQLPCNFIYGCGNELYFFTQRDRKYLGGSRPSRSAGDGSWKATSTVKQILGCQKVIIGHKRTLVYHYNQKSTSSKQKKSNWIMYEYWIDDNCIKSDGTKRKTMDGFVLCRIYERKTHSDRDRNDASIEVPVEDNSLCVTPMLQETTHYNEDSIKVQVEDNSSGAGPMLQSTTQYKEDSINEVKLEDNSSWATPMFQRTTPYNQNSIEIPVDGNFLLAIPTFQATARYNENYIEAPVGVNPSWAAARFQARAQSNEVSFDVPVEGNSSWATPMFQVASQSNEVPIEVPVEDNSLWATPMFQTQYNEDGMKAPVENNSLWGAPRFQPTARPNEVSNKVLVEDNSLWTTPVFHATTQYNEDSMKVSIEDNSLWDTSRFQATHQSNEVSIDVPMEDNSLWGTPLFQVTAQSNEVPIGVPAEDNSLWNTPMFQPIAQPMRAPVDNISLQATPMFQSRIQSNEESLTIPKIRGHALEQIVLKHRQQATYESVVDQASAQGNKETAWAKPMFQQYYGESASHHLVHPNDFASSGLAQGMHENGMNTKIPTSSSINMFCNNPYRIVRREFPAGDYTTAVSTFN